MSNSALVTYTQLSPNCTKPRNHKIDTITIHCTAGSKTRSADKTANSARFVTADSVNGASCNYVVGGDGSVALVVEEKNRSWCSSNKANDHRAVTIEVASNTAGTEVTETAYQKLLELVTDICQRNGIQKLVWSTEKNDRVNHLNGCNMTVHRDYANKACPGQWLYSRHGEIAQEVNSRLEASSARNASSPAGNSILFGGTEQVTEQDREQDKEEETVTLDQFKDFYKQMRAELQDNDCGDWSQEGRQFVQDAGIMVGGTGDNFMWEDVLTREQMAVVLFRFAKWLGKA
jgi:hypothetical protein